MSRKIDARRCWNFPLTAALLAVACAPSAPEPEVGTVEVPVSATVSAPSAEPPEPTATAPAAQPTASQVAVIETSAAPSASTAPPTLSASASASALPAAPTPFPGSEAKLEGHRVVPTLPIRFHTGKATVHEDSLDALRQIKQLLDAKPAISLLRVEVHTDSMGSDEMNLQLSIGRSLAVAKELVKLGVACKRIIPVGFGETKPLVQNDTAEGRAQNRRTEFIVASLKGKLINGVAADGGGVSGGDPCK